MSQNNWKPCSEAKKPDWPAPTDVFFVFLTPDTNTHTQHYSFHMTLPQWRIQECLKVGADRRKQASRLGGGKGEFPPLIILFIAMGDFLLGCFRLWETLFFGLSCLGDFLLEVFLPPLNKTKREPCAKVDVNRCKEGVNERKNR